MKVNSDLKKCAFQSGATGPIRACAFLLTAVVLIILVSWNSEASDQGAPDHPALPMVPNADVGESIPRAPGFEPGKEPTPKRPHEPPAERRLREGSDKYRGMIEIPAGAFDFGSPAGRPDETPVVKVFIKEFHIAKNEVSAEEYCEFLNRRGDKSKDGEPRVATDCPDCPVMKLGKAYRPRPGLGDRPMVCVSWSGAAEFAEWVGGRLPTSAEWEKAATVIVQRRPEDRVRLTGNVITDVSKAEPGVGGVRGLVGNVWEWCADWYKRDYNLECPPNNPPGPALGTEKHIRGGSWAAAECSLRIKNRHKAPPRGYFGVVGLRIVKD